MKHSRREFLKTSGAALACACLGSLCLHSCSSFSCASGTPVALVGSFRVEAEQVVIDLERTSELTAIGGSIKLEFNHPDDGTLTKIVIIHPEDAAFLAFANTCTHRGKELCYAHSAGKIQCVSGHSEFDLSGKVLGGNAEKPLKGYPTQLVGNTLIVRI